MVKMDLRQIEWFLRYSPQKNSSFYPLMEFLHLILVYAFKLEQINFLFK